MPRFAPPRFVFALAVTITAISSGACAAAGHAERSATACTTETASCPAPSSPTPIESAQALALLATLRMAGKAPRTGYDRGQYGDSWSDEVTVDGGGNGCRTREDILRRDLDDITIVPGTRGCVVASGLLHDRYTGQTVAFTRGDRTSDEVQVDHVVSLANSWQTGAQQLLPQRRRDLANDPLNLQATIGAVNRQKGDSDAATWLPPAKPYRCEYISRQIRVKAAYGLWVTQPEKDAMTRTLNAC